MRDKPCNRYAAHPPHSWRAVLWSLPLRGGRRFTARRVVWCEGILIVAPCGKSETHPPHRHGEFLDKLCRGAGLAAVCPHGVQMLNECDSCR